jgi:hypothetical protein
MVISCEPGDCKEISVEVNPGEVLTVRDYQIQGSYAIRGLTNSARGKLVKPSAANGGGGARARGVI